MLTKLVLNASHPIKALSTFLLVRSLIFVAVYVVRFSPNAKFNVLATSLNLDRLQILLIGWRFGTQYICHRILLKKLNHFCVLESLLEVVH